MCFEFIEHGNEWTDGRAGERAGRQAGTDHLREQGLCDKVLETAAAAAAVNDDTCSLDNDRLLFVASRANQEEGTFRMRKMSRE